MSESTTDTETKNGEEEASRDFGNEQDMPVADKPNPTLGPTEAAQDMSTLNQIIVPVGAYTDPNNPQAQSASVNLTLDKSPVEHSEDYGATALGEAGVEADAGSAGMVTTEEGAGSTATPAVPGEAAATTDYNSQLKADLLAEAQSRDLDVTSANTKDEIIVALEADDAAKAGEVQATS